MGNEILNTKALFQNRYKELINEYELFCHTLKSDAPIYLRPNLNELSTQDLKDYLERYYPQQKASIPYRCLPIVQVTGVRKFWGGLKEHHTGLYFMQALSSTISVEALEVQSSDTVLDMCAAPGGKATHLSSLLISGVLYANEPSLERARVLKANCDRLYCSNVIITNQKGEDLSIDKLNGGFDKILLDGPCSSEGTIRGKTIKHRYLDYHQDFRQKLQVIQKELILNAAGLLKSGGSLVYSTCTYDPDENEKIVDYALSECPDLKLVPLPEKLSELRFVDGLDEMRLTKRVYPHYVDSIGFYVAKFIKL